jgi:hypothetical protein
VNPAAATAQPAPASFHVSSTVQIRETPLRAAHRSTSLKDDLAAIRSLDPVTAFKWLGAGAGLAMVIIAAIFSLQAVADGREPPSTPNDLELPDNNGRVAADFQVPDTTKR